MQKILSGSLQSLLTALRPPEELLVKAKSEVSLVACTTPSQSISLDLNNSRLGSTSTSTSKRPNSSFSGSTIGPVPGQLRVRSKSLENMNCGAMWSSFVEEVILKKGDKGLGFSILDYQVSRNSGQRPLSRFARYLRS